MKFAYCPNTSNTECDTYGEVILEQRLRDALATLNHALPTYDIHCTANIPFFLKHVLSPKVN